MKWLQNLALKLQRFMTGRYGGDQLNMALLVLSLLLTMVCSFFPFGWIGQLLSMVILALAVFREAISRRLWIGIALVTLSSMILSVEDASSFAFSGGSLLVLLACVCWGFENNCTRMLSVKNPLEIVVIKGLCSGGTSLCIALFLGARLTAADVPAVLGYTRQVVYIDNRAARAGRGAHERLLRRRPVHRRRAVHAAVRRAPRRALLPRAGGHGGGHVLRLRRICIIRELTAHILQNSRGKPE